MAPAENPIKKQLDALPGANTLRAATTQALRQLRADLGKLDEAVVRVAELDTAGSGEAGRIDGRLGVYAREIARAREDGTGDEERLELLTELERTVADLRGDVTAYRAGDRTREFASEYARIRRIIFSSSGWQHGWANRGRYQDGERDDLEKAIGIISEAKAETAFREIMEAGVWQPYPGGVETGARLAALVARKDLMPTVKKLKEHGVFEGWYVNNIVEDDGRAIEAMRDERLFETALDFLAIIGRAEDLDSPWGIQKYRSLRDFGRDERQSLLRTYMRLKGLSGHDPRKDMLASSDISDFMEIVRKKGRAYVERMTDTLDGRLYGSAETLDGGSTGKRHPISMRNWTRWYDAYDALDEADKRIVREVWQGVVERFGWRADTDSLPYMVEFAGTPAAYREQVFGRIEAFQARFPEWFKDGSAFSWSSLGTYARLAEMPDQEFAAFLDYMARMSVLTGFYFSWGTVNDCIRLRISGGGEVAIALHERNPKIEAIRMEPSLLARVASLPASERAGVVDFIAELSKDRKIRSIDKERMDTIIATVRTGQPDVIRAVGRIFSMIGSNQIWILPEDLGKEAFQTMMIRIADSAKGLDLSIPEGSYKSSPERDKAFRQARTGVIVARRLTRDGTDTKQAMARLDGYLRAVDTLMDRPTSDGVAEALSVLGLGELRKFDPTHRARYEELFDIFTLDLSNTIAKNIDYSGTPGSLSTVMADTSTPKDTLEGYFNYLDKKDRLTLPEDIARRISAEAASGTIVVTPRNMALVGEFVQRLGDIRTQASAGSPVFEEERVDMPALVARLFPHRQWNMGASPEALYSSVMSMIRLDMDEGGIRDISALHRLMKLRGAWEPASSGRDRSSGRAASVFWPLDIARIDTAVVLADTDYSLAACGEWCEPEQLERIRVFLGEHVGYQKATTFVLDIGRRLIERNAPSYMNIADIVALGIRLRSEKLHYSKKDAENLYALIGSFMLNKAVDFLRAELGPDRAREDEVTAALAANGRSLADIESALAGQGMAVSSNPGNIAKGLKQLRDGQWGYLAGSVKAKALAAIRGPDNGEYGKKADVRMSPSSWRAAPGVRIQQVVWDGEEKGRLFSIAPDRVRANIRTGTNERRMITPAEMESDGRQTVLEAALAFSTADGEMTELAVKEGKPMSVLLNADGKDALVLTDPAGRLRILDKRTVRLHEAYDIAGIRPTVPDRPLDIVRRLEDYHDFLEVLARGEVSLLSSMMLIRDGVPEYGRDNEAKTKRLLVEYADGTIAVFSGTKALTTNEAVSIVNASGDVKHAVYMDTGNYNAAFYHEPGQPEPRPLGHLERESEVSNMLVLSLAPDRRPSEGAKSPAIVERDAWGARPPREGSYFTRYPGDLRETLDTIVVHHSAMGGDGGPKAIQDLEMDSMGYDDIAYHFVIARDGTVYRWRPLDVMGAHAGQTREANDLAKAAREIADPVERDHAVDEARKLDPDYGSIGVVLDGNLESEPPTPEQRKALEDLLAYLKTEYRIPLDRIMGHKHVKTSVTEGRGLEFAGKCETDDPHFCTLCPGHEGERLLHTVSDALPADSDEAKKKLAR